MDPLNRASVPRPGSRGREGGATWLSALLAPVSVDEFIAGYWGRRHLHHAGPRHRFSHLLSWDHLNRILEHHHRETYRFRLAMHGRDLDASSYADVNARPPRVRADRLTEHLRRGATLSFNAIDEVHEPLTRLAESFEAFFGCDTQINIYASWRDIHGLDLHHDDEEVFILHLDGRKRWLLYGESIEGVDRTPFTDRTAFDESPAPARGALLDQILQPGDLLYIPRGCYHIALPLNEPTLHLTVGIKTVREPDLIRWLASRLQEGGALNRDVPTLAGSADRLEFVNLLRTKLADSLEGDVVEQYLAAGSNRKRRPAFALPWSATPTRLPPDNDFLVSLRGGITIVDRNDAQTVIVDGRNQPYRFPRGVQWIVDRLLDQPVTPFAELIEALRARLDEDEVRLLTGLLARHDLLVISEPTAAPHPDHVER